MSRELIISDSEPIFHISEAAKILGVSIHTLRKYESQGLILPHKSESNQRIYSKKDLDRINCIRNAIKEKKVGINGIKIIYSLIPCWEIIQCSEEERSNCSAYNGAETPCWTTNHPNTICEGRDCRECSVYLNYSECGKIKELIKTL